MLSLGAGREASLSFCFSRMYLLSGSLSDGYISLSASIILLFVTEACVWACQGVRVFEKKKKIVWFVLSTATFWNDFNETILKVFRLSDAAKLQLDLNVKFNSFLFKASQIWICSHDDVLPRRCWLL